MQTQASPGPSASTLGTPGAAGQQPGSLFSTPQHTSPQACPAVMAAGAPPPPAPRPPQRSRGVRLGPMGAPRHRALSWRRPYLGLRRLWRGRRWMCRLTGRPIRGVYGRRTSPRTEKVLWVPRIGVRCWARHSTRVPRRLCPRTCPGARVLSCMRWTALRRNGRWPRFGPQALTAPRTSGTARTCARSWTDLRTCHPTCREVRSKTKSTSSSRVLVGTGRCTATWLIASRPARHLIRR